MAVFYFGKQGCGSERGQEQIDPFASHYEPLGGIERIGNAAGMMPYLLLFSAAFFAATVLPLQSEAVLVGLLALNTHPVAILLGVATIGNVLGSVVNWVLGRYLLRFRQRKWFPVSDRQLEKAQNWYRRYGLWSLLGSWLPVVGDPLTVVAGTMRAPLGTFLVLVTLAKGTRYMALAALTLAWI